MSTNTWGMLPKNYEDAEKIEEAIARLIEAHEDDPTAHLGETQSLKSHRSQESIDHLAGSVVEENIRDSNISLRKLTSTHRTIICAFESMDAWDTSGNILNRLGGVRLGTDAIAESSAYCSQNGILTFTDFDKELMFQFVGKISSVDDVVAYMGISNIPASGSDSSSITFKILNGSLYIEIVGQDSLDAWHTTTEEITGIDATSTHTYRFLHQPAEGKIEVFIDGILKNTISENLPKGVIDPIANFDIKTEVATAKYLYLMDLLISIGL